MLCTNWREYGVSMLSPIKQCATPGCTNEGPAAIPILAYQGYASDEEAKRDARCRTCCEEVGRALDPVTAEQLPEVRTRVMRMTVGQLRGQRVPAYLD